MNKQTTITTTSDVNDRECFTHYTQ